MEGQSREHLDHYKTVGKITQDPKHVRIKKGIKLGQEVEMVVDLTTA